MKVYLDTNIVSALAKDDMPAERGALDRLLEFSDVGKLKLVTSEITRREIQKLDSIPNIDKDKRHLNVVYRLLEKVEFVEDHRLLGIHSYGDRYTWINSPLIEDDPISSALRQIGLDKTDAHHLMLAIRAGCEVFLTCDVRTILKYRREIESQFSTIKLRKPSELITELERS